eukprot:scaffold136097_cov13-Tisochrysis_lutea.AAC.1
MQKSIGAQTSSEEDVHLITPAICTARRNACNFCPLQIVCSIPHTSAVQRGMVLPGAGALNTGPVLLALLALIL